MPWVRTRGTFDVEDLGLQVKRAQAHLLEHLYGAMTGLGGAEAEYLLEEDPESVMGREKLKKVRMLLSALPTCMSHEQLIQYCHLEFLD